MLLPWCLFGYVALNGLLSTQGASLFMKDDFIVHDLALRTAKLVKWAGSITHCALLCEHDYECRTFMYKKDDKKCSIYAKSTPFLKIETNKADLKTMTTFRIKGNGRQACLDSGYFHNKVRGLCWRYNNNNRKFSDAVKECRAVGAQMIMHINKDDATYINKIHRQNGIDGGWFIGMTDRDKEGAWRWLDNTWGGFKFINGADNDFDGAHKGKGADCAVVNKKTNNIFDVFCGAKYSFVCERLDLL